jgi:hypothetical protein
MKLSDAQAIAVRHELVLTEQRGMVGHFAHLSRGWHLSLGSFCLDEHGCIDGNAFNSTLGLHLKVFEGDPSGIERPNHLNSADWRFKYLQRAATEDRDHPLTQHLMRSFPLEVEVALIATIDAAATERPAMTKKTFQITAHYLTTHGHHHSCRIEVEGYDITTAHDEGIRRIKTDKRRRYAGKMDSDCVELRDPPDRAALVTTE